VGGDHGTHLSNQPHVRCAICIKTRATKYIYLILSDALSQDSENEPFHYLKKNTNPKKTHNLGNMKHVLHVCLIFTMFVSIYLTRLLRYYRYYTLFQVLQTCFKV
jgi:hypothetical protein